MFTEDVFGYTVSPFSDGYKDLKKIAKIMRLCLGNKPFLNSYFLHNDMLKEACDKLSGNDFYKTLKMIPDGILKCDVGKVNELYFLNTVCFGIDADVANNIDIMKIKGISTNKLYIASLMNTFLKYNCKKMTFNLNNTEVSGEFTTLAVCNGKFYGNGFKIAPKAKIDDGFFDFYFVDKMSKLKMFNLIMKLKSGTHDFSPLVHKRLVSQLKVKSKKNIISNHHIMRTAPPLLQ